MRDGAGCSRTDRASLRIGIAARPRLFSGPPHGRCEPREWFRPSGRPCFRIAMCVNTKSPAVIGVPSLHRAFGRMWYVSVNGDVLVKSTRETSLGRHVKSGPTSKGDSRTLETMRSRVIREVPGPQRSSRGFRHAGSGGTCATTTAPPRFGVCAGAPPAPETARSETAIAAARATPRATSSPRSRAGSRGGTRSSGQRCRTRPWRRTGRAGSSGRHSRAPGRLG